MSFISIPMIFVPKVIKTVAINSDKRRRENEDKFGELKNRAPVEGAAKIKDVAVQVEELMSQTENKVKIQIIRANAFFWIFFLVFVCLFASFCSGLSNS